MHAVDCCDQRTTLKQPTVHAELTHVPNGTFAAAPGIESGPTTVKVDGQALRVYVTVQSPLPDGSVSEFGKALQTRGIQKREPQGVIRTVESFQLHVLSGWHELLSQLADLAKW